MSKENKQKSNFFSKVFGTYTPPAWMKKAGEIVKHSQKFHKGVKIGAISLCSLAGVAIIFLLGLLTVNFIKSKKPVEITVGFSISRPNVAYSSTDPLYIRFHGSVAPLDAMEKPVSGVSFTPAMNGKWEWSGDNTLVFSPSESWKIGTNYTINFGKGVFAKHVNVDAKPSNSSFTTAGFSQSLSNAEFVIDDIDPKKKYITFRVSTNFPMLEQDLTSLVSLKPDMKNPKNGTLENREYKVEQFFDEKYTTVYFKSEVLGVPATDISFDIKVKSGIKCSIGDAVSKETLSAHVIVPGSNAFARIRSVRTDFLLNEKQEYDQIVTVETSAKISIEELNKNISFYLLPKDRPAEPGIREEKNFYWDRTEYVTDTVLKSSDKLPVKAYETENVFEPVHNYYVDIPERGFIYVKVNEGAKFYGDYYLSENFETIARTESYPKELNFVSEGNLVSLNGSRRVPILTRGIPDVDIKVWRLKPDEVNHIVSQSNGDIKNFRFESSRFDEDNVGEYVYNSSLKTQSKSAKKITYMDFDFNKYLDQIPSKDLRYGLFFMRLSGKGVRTVTKLVMVSDQAMIIKKHRNGEYDLFVQSISSGNPVASSIVKVVGLNGDILATTSTDRNGHASIPKITSNITNPVAITATTGNDMVFVPYEMHGRWVDYSNFDVGGIYGAQDNDKLSAYIFNDRGIYRPGDEIRFGAIVKAGDWTRNLGGTPMAYVITDPNGNDIYEKEFVLNADGFEEIKYSTKDYSPTGQYNFYLYLKKKKQNSDLYERILIGSQTAKVEEFMPDTLQVSSNFEPIPATGWIHPQNLSAIVKVKNLFGTAAAGNKVTAEMRLDPGYIRFNKYKDFSFRDPFISKESYVERMDDATTDENGYARFNIDMERFAPASYRLVFTADGYEKESGRSTSTSSSLYVSPLDYLIGYKADGSLSYIKKDSKRMLKFVAVGPDLESIKVDDVKLVLTENRYVSVLIKQPNGIYKYQSVKKEYPVLEQKISIPKDGMEYYLPVDTEGDFVLQLFDSNGNKFTSVDYSIVGEKNVQRSLSRTAEIEVRMAKSDYKKGETAELLIKAPYAGSGLICVERDKLYTYKWFSITETSTVQRITIPNNIEGNGYITVMFKRAYNSDEVYMSPFCYAAVPFSVSLDDRKNNIKLDVPDVVKPDTDYEIKFSSDKKAKILIMAIDEGILQVAKYKTPDPLPFFFQKRALEVASYQTLDLIMPEFNILKTLTAAGGGGDYENYLSHNLNPFKKRQNAPVAYWSGIIDTSSKETSVKYHIPSYFNGKLRVMAVAVAGETIGVSEASTEVRDTYVIVPNCPNFAAPGDEFDVSVTVTNNDAGSGENAGVKLTAITDKGLTAVGNSSVDLKISEGKDATYTFRFKANDVLGNSDIKFQTQGPVNGSKLTSSLSVRPSMPYQVWLESGKVRKSENTKDKVNVDRQLYDEFATREVNLSYLPLGFAKGLNFYLDKYPYGCSEQVTSAAFPYLFPELLKNSGKATAEARYAIENVIEILQSRQKDDGTIGYWTPKSDSYDELDAYCALFLTIAKENGYFVPEKMFNKLMNALKLHATESNNYAAAFAIYVLTRNEIVTTTYLERMAKKVDLTDKMSLTGIYMAASYKLLQMNSEAEKIMKKVRKGVNKDLVVYRFESNLYYNASFLYLISEYFPDYLKVISEDLLTSIEGAVIDREYNTLSSAMTLMAIQSYLKAVPTATTGKFVVTQDFGKDAESEPIVVTGENVFTGNFEGKTKNLLLANNESTNLFYQVTQAGFMKSIPESETSDNGLEVSRIYSKTPGGAAVKSFNLGDEVYVTVKLRSTKNSYIHNIALVDMLPSGLEADFNSIRENGSGWNPDNIDIREDRVIFYGTATKDVSSFTYKAKAITNGNFIVPPLFAQAMYENKVKALKPYENIEIRKPSEK